MYKSRLFGAIDRSNILPSFLSMLLERTDSNIYHQNSIWIS
jgi:hypothetical protein